MLNLPGWSVMGSSELRGVGDVLRVGAAGLVDGRDREGVLALGRRERLALRDRLAVVGGGAARDPRAAGLVVARELGGVLAARAIRHVAGRRDEGDRRVGDVGRGRLRV